jgi:hypothetical protein
MTSPPNMWRVAVNNSRAVNFATQKQSGSFRLAHAHEIRSIDAYADGFGGLAVPFHFSKKVRYRRRKHQITVIGINGQRDFVGSVNRPILGFSGKLLEGVGKLLTGVGHRAEGGSRNRKLKVFRT